MKLVSILTTLSFLIVSFSSVLYGITTEKPIVIIIPSFNNGDWYKRNLDSVFMQRYENYRVIYIDDYSSDDTGKLVEAYVYEHSMADRFIMIKNKNRVGALMNLYRAIHSCEDYEIIVTLDGDDWFKHELVLARINAVYQDDNVWMTYGQYEQYPSGRVGLCRPYPSHIQEGCHYREYDWIASHLRTFYAGLFKRIKLRDLMYEKTLFPVTWDLAMMFPMLEMAAGRYKCLHDVLYIYNYQTPHNDAKLRLYEQMHCEYLIRAKQKYKKIDSLESPSYRVQKKVDILVFETGTTKINNTFFDFLDGVGVTHLIPAKDQSNITQSLLWVLDQVESEYVFLVCDSCRLTERVDLAEIATMLAQTKALLFSLILSNQAFSYEGIEREIYPPSLVPLTNKICAWKIVSGEFMWKYPYNFDALVIKVEKLKKILKDINVQQLEELCACLNQVHFDIEDVALCFEKLVVEKN